MTRTRPKTDPSVRTYYLLFDGKTLTTKRPDTKVKAVQRASSTKEAREKLATRFVLLGGVFRGRVKQTSRPLPTDQPSMREKVRKMATADAKLSEPLDLGEILAEAERLEPVLPQNVTVVVGGLTLRLRPDSTLDLTTPGTLKITLPDPMVGDEPVLAPLVN